MASSKADAREQLDRETGLPVAAEPLKPKPIDWVAWKGRTPPPREWWLQEWLGPAPTLCAGRGGSGKSTLWQTIGTALATGREFFGPFLAGRALRVLVWACEDDENELVRRQDAICAHLKIERTELAGKLDVEPRLGYDNTLLDLEFGKPTFTTNFLLLREQVNDIGVDLLVLDNIAQVYGGNANDNHQVTKFVNGIQGMVRGRSFCPVFLGHVARTQGSEWSGAAAWENACRMRWYLGPALPDQKVEEDEGQDPDVIYLAKRKANYTDKDWARLRYNGGLFVPDRAEGRRVDQTYRDDTAERIVMKSMAKFTDMGIQPTDGKTSGDYLPKQIVEKRLNESHSKRELTDAMHRLMAAGKLKRVQVGQYNNRNPRFRLAVA